MPRIRLALQVTADSLRAKFEGLEANLVVTCLGGIPRQRGSDGLSISRHDTTAL
jgi:hypothetical protein